ncbi:phosphotransferase [Hydrogenophaga sp. SNF1]|uniref:phosphotransferase enzyme family protein n=1 Tax=Hydrogenophaga sp. SNF1 TaxID=3098762 RepID=UPI002ACC2C50|nr:phosphotransferase [Hydrogenophaga sp. SNF1]WQB85162.1 phosphotransferase [Hydrogenophaga sp. SNF1]
MDLEIAQSTPTAAAIARVVQANYPVGEVVASEFLRRSFNQVYRLTLADGRRVVARLCAERPRGEPNLAFEAAALRHLQAQGCPVSASLPTAQGEVAMRVRLPEGERALMLFEHLDGEATADVPANIEAFGRGLARLHAAGEAFDAGASRYRLDLDYLLMQPLQRLLRAPTMTAELRSPFEVLGVRLRDRILALGPLSRVLCHGDAHGENNFVVGHEHGERQAVFFDFDEIGPGYLAYELAVYPWSLHPRSVDGVWSDKALARWNGFIAAYRAVRELGEADIAALGPFVAVRQFWLLGEYAGRVPVWGSQAMPTDYLQRQVKLLTQWEALELPVPPAVATAGPAH